VLDCVQILKNGCALRRQLRPLRVQLLSQLFSPLMCLFFHAHQNPYALSGHQTMVIVKSFAGKVNNNY
jgi:hypothetical protein